MHSGTLLFFFLGLALLIAGGELLVRGSSRLARRAGISELVVGLTVVAFGTSSPEMVVSVLAALQGRSEIAVGNVVGSNTFNVLFILGLAALIRPLVVARVLVRRDIPIMIGASLVFWLFATDLAISKTEALAFIGGIVAFTGYTVWASRREPAPAYDAAPLPVGVRGLPADLAAVLAGLAMLVVGARWLVDAAVAAARVLGVDESVIALTIVAAGTSLPEVVTSAVATARGKSDIAVGNIVGSNIFNLLAILGVSAMFGAGGLRVAPAMENFDIPVMIAVAIACLPFLATGHVLARWEGAVFLGYYALYTAYLVLSVQQHAALPLLGRVTAWFVLPITGLTIVVVVLRAMKRANARRAIGVVACLLVPLAAGCGGRSEPAVEAWESGAWQPRAIRTYRISGERDGAATTAVAEFTLEDGARLRVELEVVYDPTPMLGAGRWELDGGGGGGMRAESIKFLGGQGEGPSLGGRFLLHENGAPRFRVYLPSRPLPRPGR